MMRVFGLGIESTKAAAGVPRPRSPSQYQEGSHAVEHELLFSECASVLNRSFRKSHFRDLGQSQAMSLRPASAKNSSRGNAASK
jgi:hypothetical protein